MIGVGVETEDGAAAVAVAVTEVGVAATTGVGEATVAEAVTEVVVVVGMTVVVVAVEEEVEEEDLHRGNREGKSHVIVRVPTADRNATLGFSIPEHLQLSILDCKITRRTRSLILSALSPSAKETFRTAPILVWRVPK